MALLSNKLNIKDWLNNSHLKKLSCFVLAFFIVLILFYVMSVLIAGDKTIRRHLPAEGLVEFIRTKPKDFLEEKKRKLPQKKPKEPPPPRPKKLKAVLAPSQKMNVKMDLPRVKSLLRSGLGPAMGFSSMSMGLHPLVRVEPQYPQKASIKGIEGRVRLQFDITPQGGTTNIKILESHPQGVFERAAVQAVRKWKYRPQQENGRSVGQKGQTTEFDFELE